MITAIACVFDSLSHYFIGLNNDLLFDIKTDKRFFRNYIKGKILICGYNTYKTLPKSIIESHTILVLTKNHYNEFEDIDKEQYFRFSYVNKTLACKNINDIIELSKKFTHKNFVVIGGGEIYKLFEPYIEFWHLTIINSCIYNDTELMCENAVTIPYISRKSDYKCISYNLISQIEYDHKTEMDVKINIFSFYRCTNDANIFFEKSCVNDLINKYVR